MAAPMMLQARDSTVEAGDPVAVFTMRPGSEFAPSSDGQRFLVNAPLENAAMPPLTVILNWRPRP